MKSVRISVAWSYEGTQWMTLATHGAPKGVLHTQATLAYKAALMADVHGLEEMDAAVLDYSDFRIEYFRSGYFP